MKYVIYFLILFIVMNLIFYFFMYRKYQKRKDKYPSEVDYLIKLYKLDIKKINYKQLLRTLCLVNSFIISCACLIVFVVDGFMLQLLCGFLILVILIIVLYGIIGKTYVKKGMKKDDK